MEETLEQVKEIEAKFNELRDEGFEYFAKAHRLISELRTELEKNYQIVKNHY
jgi:hypothetical protein